MGSLEKIAVVLDTNIIFNHWFFDSPNFNLLEVACNLGLFEVYIPEVVYLELQANYSKELQDSIRYNNFCRLTKRLGIDLPSLEYINEEYKNFLDNKINNSCFKNLSLPEEINVKKILVKSVKGKKPFKGSSGKGLKDELIWQTILKSLLSNRYKVYFITNNVKDFGYNTNLHRDLKEDLLELEISDGSCIIYKSLPDFIEKYVIPKLESPEESVSQFIEKFIQEKIHKFIDEIEIKCNYFLDLYIEDPELIDISLEEHTFIEEIRYLSDGYDQVYARIITGGQAVIDAFLFKSDYYALDPNVKKFISIMDEDWNDHYMWIEIYPQVTLNLSIILNIRTKEVISFEGELECDEIYGFCKYCSEPLYSDAAEVCPNCGKNLF